MKNQTGGVKLLDTIIGKERVGFKPIFNMITNPTSSMSFLQSNSRYGFMFNLQVDSADSNYLMLSKERQFTKPVEQFIFKTVVIVEKNTHDRNLKDFFDVEKQAETRLLFRKEADLQQTIWIRSIDGGKPEICPSVANLSTFINQDGQYLLELIKDKMTPETPETPGTIFSWKWLEYLRQLTPFAVSIPTAPTILDATIIDALDYLLTALKNTRQFHIGVLTMPTITNSTTLNNFVKLPLGSNFHGLIVTTKHQLTALANAVAQTVRLFVHIGVIHFDLHSINILIYITDDKQIKSVLIDFGRASDITDGVRDKMLELDEKNEILAKKDEFLQRQLMPNLTDKDKAEFMFDVMDYLDVGIIDYLASKDKYKHYDSDTRPYTIEWYRVTELNNRSSQENRRLMINAFNILTRLTTDVNIDLLDGTIRELQDEGLILDVYPRTTSYALSNELREASASETELDSDDDTFDDDTFDDEKRKGGRTKQTRNKNKNTKQSHNKKHKRTIKNNKKQHRIT
jgi:hypothetical protein